MKTKFNGILTLLLAFVVQLTFAQEKTISGTVVDETNMPLPGATVIIKGTTTGASTDFDGKYKFKASNFGIYTLEAKYDSIVVVWDKGALISSNYVELYFDMKESDTLIYRAPFMDKEGRVSGRTVTREDIAKMPKPSPHSIINAVAVPEEKNTSNGSLTKKPFGKSSGAKERKAPPLMDGAN